MVFFWVEWKEEFWVLKRSSCTSLPSKNINILLQSLWKHMSQFTFIIQSCHRHISCYFILKTQSIFKWIYRFLHIFCTFYKFSLHFEEIGEYHYCFVMIGVLDDKIVHLLDVHSCLIYVKLTLESLILNAHFKLEHLYIIFFYHLHRYQLLILLPFLIRLNKQHLFLSLCTCHLLVELHSLALFLVKPLEILFLFFFRLCIDWLHASGCVKGPKFFFGVEVLFSHWENGYNRLSWFCQGLRSCLLSFFYYLI